VVVVGLKALDPEWPIREAIDPEEKIIPHRSDQPIHRARTAGAEKL
jgi:hypothetical protein